MLDSDQQTFPAMAIARAVGALRQNKAVIVANTARPDRPALVMAAETLTEADLLRAWSMAEEAPRLVLSARRAVVIGHAIGRDTGAVRLPLDRALSARTIRGVIDPLAEAVLPSATLGRMIPARPASVDGIAVALTKLGELLPAAVVAPLADREPPLDRSLADVERYTFALDDVVRHQERIAADLVKVAEARVPLFDCEASRLVTFRPATGGPEHVAVVLGRLASDRPVLARLHSSCLTGDLLGSLRCDCGEQLRGAIRAIGDAGGGVLLYLNQEGRNIGLVNKLRAYGLQDRGLDTVDANEHLGFESDERDYRVAAEMLRQLGVGAVRLMTNNPAKIAALQRYGVRVVERVPHAFPANTHNRAYLQTKAARSGHFLPLGDEYPIDRARGAHPAAVAHSAHPAKVAAMHAAGKREALLGQGA